MPVVGAITSLHNPQIRAIARLKSKKRDRYREQRFLGEGQRLIRHALTRGHRPAFAFYTADYAAGVEGAALVSDLLGEGVPLWEVTPDVMAALADTLTPQGIVAVFPMPAARTEQAQTARLLLILDALRTPGNVGTILRTAQATGVNAVICAPGTVDPFSPKVVRSGMGAHFDLPLLVDVQWESIAALVEGRHVWAATAEGQTLLWEADLSGCIALVIGSEAHGLGPEARALAQAFIRIPMVETAESLNAAVAASALLFEAQRQRWQQG
ncbi:MAG: RNA methyltransferase [Chloroflexi bacterium]|nr:RNA methyltransferase [Chloroflexota bacterium]